MAETLPAAAHRHGAPQTLMPTVSIIVPVYNVGEQLLRPCIESALTQTFRDFELILVDDCSTDNSAAICADYTSDPRVRLLLLEQNGGLANARNQGVKASTGQYITFLDADDQLTPDALKLLYAAATQTEADIVAAEFLTSRCSLKTAATCSVLQFTPAEAVADVLYQCRINNSACGKLYRREICEAEPFRSGWYEDLRTIPHMFLAANRVAYLPEPVYIYTDNPASYLHTFNLGRAVVLDVTDELVAVMPTPELKRAARDRALSAAFNIFNLLTVYKVAAPDIETRCRATILRYRRESLFNPRVRLKNKLGILLTYLGGFPALRLAAKLFRKK
ncbi:MAG: glycosyltransferase [Bacteroides sp.]|nr:glycosyltransferase [Bacteroides sp.]MCM1379392.1 glycosyltransferase [Bacteroides sp.]MCM1445252.1 glycosyltransferase [Prevotella sp.]